MEELKKKLNRLLVPLLGREHLSAWWESKNRAFQNKTPNEMLEIDPETVKSYVVSQYNGSYF